MSDSQKVLKVFGVLEIALAIFGVGSAIQNGGVSAWLSVVTSLLAAYLLLTAAKDASKIMGAWAIVLLDLILSVLELILALTGARNMTVIVGSIIAIILNLIVFIAANNVKNQANK